LSRTDVSRYSRISARFWTDEKSSAWNDRVKLAALYLLTCSHRHLEGIYVLPLQYACSDLRWSLKSWKSALTVLQESGFLKWDSQTSVVLIVNALRYQSPENPNQSAAALRRIKDLPDTPLLQEFCALALDHCYRKGATPAAQAFTQLLRQQLDERLGQPLSPLNLKSQSEPQPQPKTQSESPRQGGEGEMDRTVIKKAVGRHAKEPDEGMTKLGDVLGHWPHLQ
jgi:hypothetical protein